MNELKKILCVEDDPDIRLILEFSLARIGGYEIFCACSGMEALSVVSTFLPDLVLMDVMMPGLSGPETLLKLRELPAMKGVPVVFMTAKAMPHELTDLLDKGSVGVIVKPFDPVTLGRDIKPYWEHGRASC